MINLLLGAPGGGKSYEAVVYHVLPALSEGRKVITNLPINTDYLQAVSPDQIPLLELRQPTVTNPRPFSQIEDYGDEWRHPETGVGPLYIIDEAHMALPTQGTPRSIEEWYAMHRHELADVLLLTQSYGKVNKAVRELVQLVYRVRKNTALGDNSSYVRKVQDGLRGEVVNTNIRKYKPEYFKFYKSHTRSNNSAKEAFAKDVKPIWRHWTVYGAVASFLLVIYLGFSGYLNPFTSSENTEVSKIKTKPVSGARNAIEKALVEQKSQAKPTDRNPELEGLRLEVDRLTKQIEEMETQEHPLKKVNLHIGGLLQREKLKLYHIIASQNGQKVFETNSNELAEMGYALDTKTECLLGIQYDKYQTWLTCDSPRVGVKFKAGQG